MEKRGSKKIRRIALCAAAGILLAGGLIWHKKSQGKETEEVRIESAQVETGDVATTISTSGTVTGQLIGSVTIPSGIKIKKILVSEGQEVKKGTKLASVYKASVAEQLLTIRESIDETEDAIDNLDEDETLDTSSNSYLKKLTYDQELEDLNALEDQLEKMLSSGYIKANRKGFIGEIVITEEEESGSDEGTNLDSTDNSSGNQTSSVDVTAAKTTETGSSTASAATTILASRMGGGAAGGQGTVQLMAASDTSAASDDSVKEDTTINGMADTESEDTSTDSSESSDVQDSTQTDEKNDSSYNDDRSSQEETTESDDSGTSEESTSTTQKSTENKTTKEQSEDTSSSKKQSGTDSQKETGQESQKNTGGSSKLPTGKSGGAMSGSAASSTTSTSGSETESVGDIEMTEAFSIYSSSSVLVTVPVNEEDIQSVVEGQKAVVTLSAIEGETYTGEITGVSGQASESSGSVKYDVEVTIDRSKDMLTGMSASVVIYIDEAEGTLLIPSAAVAEKKGQAYVYTVKNDDGSLAGETEITTGLSDGSKVQVTEGLSEGDTIYYTVSRKSADNTSTGEDFFNSQMPGGGGMHENGLRPGGDGNPPSRDQGNRKSGGE